MSDKTTPGGLQQTTTMKTRDKAEGGARAQIMETIEEAAESDEVWDEKPKKKKPVYPQVLYLGANYARNFLKKKEKDDYKIVGTVRPLVANKRGKVNIVPKESFSIVSEELVCYEQLEEFYVDRKGEKHVQSKRSRYFIKTRENVIDEDQCNFRSVRDEDCKGKTTEQIGLDNLQRWLTKNDILLPDDQAGKIGRNIHLLWNLPDLWYGETDLFIPHYVRMEMAAVELCIEDLLFQVRPKGCSERGLFKIQKIEKNVPQKI